MSTVSLGNLHPLLQIQSERGKNSKNSQDLLPTPLAHKVLWCWYLSCTFHPRTNLSDTLSVVPSLPPPASENHRSHLSCCVFVFGTKLTFSTRFIPPTQHCDLIVLFSFLQLHLWHMAGPRPGVILERQLPVRTTATPDPTTCVTYTSALGNARSLTH